MLFNLVKKDFLITKKHILLLFLIGIIIPPAFQWQLSENAGFLAFTFSALFFIDLPLTYNSMKEYKCSKAATLLCAAPYSRRQIVISKYIFGTIMYLACCVLFLVQTLYLKKLGGFHIKLAILMFFVFALFQGIYIPVQFKIGYEMARNVSLILFILIWNVIVYSIVYEKTAFLRSSGFGFYGILSVVSIFILVASACLSINIYEKAELA